jgi:hypothetical protein
MSAGDYFSGLNGMLQGVSVAAGDEKSEATGESQAVQLFQKLLFHAVLACSLTVKLV